VALPSSVGAERASLRKGLTILEGLVSLVITAVALTMITRIIVAAARQRSVNTENACAANGARMALEELRNATFEQCFALYNDWNGDDPDGAGTAPGSRFAVEGLEPLPGKTDCGVLFFPSLPSALEGGSPCELREDTVDPALDLPRDLSGDSIVDGRDHAADYLILPVRATVEWQGEWGPRRLELHGLLTSFRK
jgi:type II secretory pathway pseudopilin PulG